ncbi:hypothetical protein [Rhizobium leguminosarum]|nr:hypothetical protein [Rhizobium leguminosarum]
MPTISSYEQGLRRINPDAVPALEAAFAAADRTQLRENRQSDSSS